MEENPAIKVVGPVNPDDPELKLEVPEGAQIDCVILVGKGLPDEIAVDTKQLCDFMRDMVSSAIKEMKAGAPGVVIGLQSGDDEFPLSYGMGKLESDAKP